MARKSLKDILGGSDSDDFRNHWNNTEAAGDFCPLPSGVYEARIVSGELEKSRNKATPSYKLEFIVVAGEYVGRKFWHDIWLTKAASAMAKRDLGKLMITDLGQLEMPVPPGIVCRVKLALHHEDNGTEHNKVRSFDVIRIEPPEADPFAPANGSEGGVAS